MRAALSVLLALTLLHLAEGMASIVDPAGMMTGLGVAMPPGVDIPITFLGVAMLVRSAVAVIALRWLLQGKPEGVFMARSVALTILLSAPIVFQRLPQPQFAIGDLPPNPCNRLIRGPYVHGLLLLVPAMLVKSPRGELQNPSAED